MNTSPNTDALTDSTEEMAVEIEELEMLKARADVLGLTYSPKIGVDALKKKITDYLDDDETPAVEPEKKLSKIQREAKIRQDLRKECLRLIRCRITNLNPGKKDLRGEILTVANRYLGEVKKFVPYGEVTEDGYHLEEILFRELKSRKFLSIRTRRNKRTGEIIVEQRWVPEFALEVLPQLTKEELKDLAATQGAATRNETE